MATAQNPGIKQAFDAIIMLGAGTGLVLILRWFWWRINAICEFVGMIVSFIIALLCAFSSFGDILPKEFHLLFNVAITTLCWVLTALFTKPTKKEVLYKFIEKINPTGPGWNHIKNLAKSEGVELKIKAKSSNITKGILQMILGSFCVYSVLFGLGYLLYFKYALSAVLFGVALFSGLLLIFSMREKSIKNSSL